MAADSIGGGGSAQTSYHLPYKIECTNEYGKNKVKFLMINNNLFKIYGKIYFMVDRRLERIARPHSHATHN